MSDHGAPPGEPPMPEIDPRWEAYAAGTLPEADRRELEDLAEVDPFAAACLEAFRPVSPEFHTRIADDAMTQIRPASRWRGWIGVGVAVAAAAGLLFALRPGAPSDYDAQWDTLRADPSSYVPTFSPGDRAAIALVPQVQAPEAVQVVVYLDRWSADARLDVTAESSASGWIHLEGTVGDAPWAFEPGEHRLLVAAGPPDTAPPAGAPVPPWSGWSLPFRIQR